MAASFSCNRTVEVVLHACELLQDKDRANLPPHKEEMMRSGRSANAGHPVRLDSCLMQDYPNIHTKCCQSIISASIHYRRNKRKEVPSNTLILDQMLPFFLLFALLRRERKAL